MTKNDLIEEVYYSMEMSRTQAESIVDAMFDGIVRSLRTGEKVEIRGFGSFRTRERKPRMGRNPKTGAAVSVPAKSDAATVAYDSAVGVGSLGPSGNLNT
jgi:integration host factor subunit beta